MREWNYPSVVRVCGGVPEDRVDLARQVLGHFPDLASGTVALLDTTNYDRWTGGLWARGGPLGVEMDLTEAPAFFEPHVLDQYRSARKWRNLVWISRRVARDRSAVELAWTVAHELRHVQQRRHLAILSKCNELIARNLESLGRPNLNIEIPAELDAELTAWKLCRARFGPAEADAYPQEQAAAGPSAPCYERLLQVGPDHLFELIQTTHALMEQDVSLMVQTVERICEVSSRQAHAAIMDFLSQLAVASELPGSAE